MRALPDVTSMTTRDAAVAYAEAGFAVFPLKPGGKAPATAHGRDDATNDPEVVRETWPGDEYGVGLFANPSNIVVFDVDDESKVPEHLLDVLAENPSAMVLTRKGRHVYYATDGTDYGSVFRKDDGFDLIANGYVVAAPTVARIDRDGSPVEPFTYTVAGTAVAPLPEELRELLRPLDSVETGRRATSEEVAEFVKTFTSENEPEALDRHLSALAEEFAVEHRNVVLIRRLPDVMRDAMHGKFPAEDAIEAVRLLVGSDKGWDERYDEKVEQAVGFALKDRLTVIGTHERTVDETNREDDLYNPTSLADVHLGERVAREYLAGTFVSWGRSRWSKWDGQRWAPASETTVFEAVRQAVLRIHREEVAAANARLTRANDAIAASSDSEEDKQKARDNASKDHAQRMKALNGLFFVSTLGRLMRVARGLVEVDPSQFDQQPDLLNVGNGVVDLQTSELLPHDPKYLFTKVTEVDYEPGVVHRDWTQALTALPPEVADWMQVRLGQAATGHSPDDDRVLFFSGEGSNGKSTIISAVTMALGDFAVMVPDKVLTASPSDHPTERMTLFGARFAFIEELPEGDYLKAEQLKKAVGTRTMTARPIGQDNVSWTPSHTLFLTTNYDVQIDDVTAGTWRRLTLVEFPYKFKPTGPDGNLRQRVESGDEQQRAVLAWLVEGARRWYEAERQAETAAPLPTAVKAATDQWQYHANAAARFIEEHLELDPDSAVRSNDVFRAFDEWARGNGHRRWKSETFWKRARAHEWLRSGEAVKRDGTVRAKGWNVDTGGHHWNPVPKTFERLMTGVRWTDEGRDLIARLF